MILVFFSPFGYIDRLRYILMPIKAAYPHHHLLHDTPSLSKRNQAILKKSNKLKN